MRSLPRHAALPLVLLPLSLLLAACSVGEAPAEALPRVFDRFFRVDKARSRDLGGAGLGLSIVKSICTAHHGRVEASSLPGQGSRFRVELPLAVPLTNNQKKHNHDH